MLGSLQVSRGCRFRRQRRTHNVEVERKEPGSVLSFYTQVIHLRKTEPALLQGVYIPLNPSDPNVLSYLRKSNSGTILVVLNFSATAQNPTFDLSKEGFASAESHRPLVENAASVPDGTLTTVKLRPYGVFIAASRIECALWMGVSLANKVARATKRSLRFYVSVRSSDRPRVFRPNDVHLPDRQADINKQAQAAYQAGTTAAVNNDFSDRGKHNSKKSFSLVPQIEAGHSALGAVLIRLGKFPEASKNSNKLSH